MDKSLTKNPNQTFIKCLINRINNTSTPKIIPKYTQDCLTDGTDIDFQDTERFIFPITGGRVIKVYDTDTILVAFKLPYEMSPIYRMYVKFNGIYTPKTFGKDVTIDEQYVSKKAHCFISNLLLNKYVRLHNLEFANKPDNYLATVYIDDNNLNDILIKNHYAIDENASKPSSWSRYLDNSLC